MHPPPLDQPAPSKSSGWDHLFSPSPEKKLSDTSREIRIVAAPAHLLPPQKLAVSSSSQQKDHPTCRPACLAAARLLFSPIPTATRLTCGTFHDEGPSTGYPGKNGLLA